jgi:hypothetical protein
MIGTPTPKIKPFSPEKASPHPIATQSLKSQTHNKTNWVRVADKQ